MKNPLQEKATVDELYCNDSCWYSESEIESFKNDAKMHIQALRQLQYERSVGVISTSRKRKPSKTLCTLGIESRVDVERLRRKRKIIQKVLTAQNALKSSTPSKREQCLAILSNIESFSAKCKALEEGSTIKDLAITDQNSTECMDVRKIS